MDQDNIAGVTRAELIKTFSEIDRRITDLHERSSNDFLNLNNYLKDYYKKTQTISENAFRILETIAGKTDIDLIEELGKIHQRLEDCRSRIKEDDAAKIQILRELTTRSSQLTIALRNIKQDLTTFKFLLSNYNLISNYEEGDETWKKELENRDKDLQPLHVSLVKIGTQVDRFREQIVYNIDHLELKIEKSLRIFMNLSKDIKSDIGLVLMKNQESKLQFPVLKEKTKNSSKSINNIITHLQYHDIIRQKIEHIQTTHSAIIEDLNKKIARKNAEMTRATEDFQKIGDIAGLQAAQLLLVSKEYQNALEIITKNFQGIADDLTMISSISSEFSFKDNNSEITLLKQIRNKLDEGMIMLDLNNFRGMNTEYLSARKKLEGITQGIEKEISAPLKELSRLQTLRDKDNETSVISQIATLAKEIGQRNKEIHEKMEELSTYAEELSKIDNLEDWGSQLEQDRIRLMVDISRILDNLDKDNEELDSVLKQNRELNGYILEKIENVINKVDYYEYFESIVEQVISQLNSINYRLKPVTKEETVDEKAENLKDIKNSYTMESERVIHDRVVTGDNTSVEPEEKKQEDDIEFF